MSTCFPECFMFGVNKRFENMGIFSNSLKIDRNIITYQQVWFGQSDNTTAILEENFGPAPTEFFPIKNGVIYCDIGIF